MYTKEELLALNTEHCKNKPAGEDFIAFQNLFSKNTLVATFFATRPNSCREELNDIVYKFDDKDNDKGGSALVC